jgi:serine phosphatase RsbU (regulator of sigma subunit)
MVVEAQRVPYEALARVAERLAADVELRDALELLAAAAAEATGADLAVVRCRDAATGLLIARAVAPPESPLAAELSGSRLEPGRLSQELPGASWIGAPALVADTVVGSVEVIRTGAELGEGARALIELAAAQLALALRLSPDGDTGSAGAGRLARLEREGEALAAGAELDRAAQQAARLAAEATQARGAAIWRSGGERVDLVTLDGDWSEAAIEHARTLAAETRTGWEPLLVELDEGEGAHVVSIRLGQPPFGVLQLRYQGEPAQDELDALASFAARAAHALRLGERSRELESELGRTRALLSVVGEAIARLSLAHTLETAVERIADLLAIERVGIYLLDGGRLVAAAGRDLAPGHEEVAHSLLELALGPQRARETIEVRARGGDPAHAGAVRALRSVDVDSALAVPLRLQDEAIGLLVAYPRVRRPSAADRALLASLATQLAVAVQNARLHEEAKELGEALGSVLESERQAARRLRALYEISSSFTSSLSLETTLETVARAVVDVLDVDAAVIRVPDERGDTMVTKAVHVADERLDAAVRTILERAQPTVRVRGPLVLNPARARNLGGAHALLAPFLEAGSTAAVLPIETPAEVLALLTIVSLDPASPISGDTVATAATMAAQAALAIDNARLYQQQKQLAETIQRALLPSDRPEVPGLEVGTVYESAARLDVGGDVYDFLELGDGRLAVVLGDVMGHGVDATADMALAKFVFRSLAREHPEPADFLAAANEVISGEIGLGKFITMAYVVLDPAGAVVGASAGHPAPRLLLPDGRVEPLACRGLALGIRGGQEYEEARAELPPGAAVVLYTDGVVEARRDGELYGTERLDAFLCEHRDLPPEELARGVVAACRTFAGGEVSDDCAVVVARTSPVRG